MIRINLIQPPIKEGESKVQEPSTLLEKKGFLPLLSLVVCSGVVGLLYWNSNRQIANLNQQIVIEQQEASRLAAIQAQNKTLQAQLAEIDQHTSLIENLKKNRTGPQELMTLLGDAAGGVSGLYLVSINTEKGRLTIHGQSDYMSAVADFITALQKIPSFEDVQLHEVFENDLKRGVSFDFAVDCAYRPPAQAPEASPVAVAIQPDTQMKR